jgi:hypothetical protein
MPANLPLLSADFPESGSIGDALLAPISDADLAAQVARLEGVFRQAGLRSKRRIEQTGPYVPHKRRHLRAPASTPPTTGDIEWAMGEDFFGSGAVLAFWLASGSLFHARAVARAIASPRSLFWRLHAGAPAERQPVLASMLAYKAKMADFQPRLDRLADRLCQLGEWDRARPFLLEAGEGRNPDGFVDRWEAGRWPSFVQTLLETGGSTPALSIALQNPSGQGDALLGDLALSSMHPQQLSDLLGDSAGEAPALDDHVRLLAIQEARQLDAAAQVAAEVATLARRNGGDAAPSAVLAAESGSDKSTAALPRDRLREPDLRPRAERVGVFADLGPFLLSPRNSSQTLCSDVGNFARGVALVVERGQATPDEAWAWLCEQTVPPGQGSNECFAGSGVLPFLLGFAPDVHAKRLWAVLDNAERFDPLAPLLPSGASFLDEALAVAARRPGIADRLRAWAERVPAHLTPPRWAAMARVFWAGDDNDERAEAFAQWIELRVEQARREASAPGQRANDAGDVGETAAEAPATACAPPPALPASASKLPSRAARRM